MTMKCSRCGILVWCDTAPTPDYYHPEINRAVGDNMCAACAKEVSMDGYLWYWGFAAWRGRDGYKGNRLRDALIAGIQRYKAKYNCPPTLVWVRDAHVAPPLGSKLVIKTDPKMAKNVFAFEVVHE